MYKLIKLEIRALIFWQVGCKSSNLIIHLSISDVYDSKGREPISKGLLVSSFSLDFVVFITRWQYSNKIIL